MIVKHRKLLEQCRDLRDDYEHIFLLKEGLLVRQIMCVIKLDKNVKYGYLSFIEMDIHKQKKY